MESNVCVLAGTQSREQKLRTQKLRLAGDPSAIRTSPVRLEDDDMDEDYCSYCGRFDIECECPQWEKRKRRSKMDKTVGTCSECGGRVTLPDAWMGMNPPIPTCQKCGARAKQPHGPVIPMEPNKDQYPAHDGNDIYASPPVQPDDPRPMWKADINSLKRDDREIAIYEARAKGG
jgi:hypothetical protein